ncbi:plasma membrane calcium [Podospora pseudopauciseta]|uniref:Plasma membrane calcium n=1 Tax=Podospora pseudopauciseta TaxID=2093780 RepID=A0ABR0H3H0_9PEZI|nr:plasma membrane calcium [Podospora pseudopauciseta]
MTSQHKSKEAPGEYGRRDYLSASELDFESIAGYLKLSDDVEKSDEANKPDFPVSTDLPVNDNQFTFAPGQLSKLFDSKSLSDLYKLGGLAVSGGPILWMFLKRNPTSGALQNGDEGAGAWIDDATLVGVVAVVAGILNAERSLFVRDDLEGGNHPVLPELESGGWDGAGINRSGVGHQPGVDGGAEITSIN